jgi:hypothetical protein
MVRGDGSGLDLDRFDYPAYFALLDQLASSRSPVRFVDLASKTWPARFFILRHDVDYSPSAALELARRESERGIGATYFVLMQTFYYNVLAPEWAMFPRELTALGHEVGLHYDTRALQGFDGSQAESILRSQAALLSDVAGAPVTSMVQHQPALGPEDRFRNLDGFVNAMSSRFAEQIPYVSDSCRAWRDAGFGVLSGEPPPRLQLALHPINWGTSDRPREVIFKSLHGKLSDFVLHEGRELLEKIRRHEGVRQHERRKDGTS